MTDLDPLAFGLREGRRKFGLSQVEAAARLKLSQPYLSQLERSRRRVTPKLARRAARLYGLSPTILPLAEEVRETSTDRLARRLSGLGYPGYQHLRSEGSVNPAEVLLEALSAPQFNTRICRALPWVIARYPELEWNWLISQAKQRNAQNRLGFLVSVALEMATRERASARSLATLREALGELEMARLVAETTLGRQRMPAAERKWLRSNRPPSAAHWNILTSLTAEEVL